MSGISKKLMGTTAVGGDLLAIEDVFSTYLYAGTGLGTTISIVNGIDLAGEGGMVWLKSRSVSGDNHVFDTERGATFQLRTNTTVASSQDVDTLTQFNSDGFLIDDDPEINASSVTYASWTFRKAPRFFDVVTYTGDGTSNRTISHNLGSVPGCIFVKNLTISRDWAVYHRGVDPTAPEDYYLRLNDVDARTNTSTFWNDTAPTDTEFTLGNGLQVNGSGYEYVAYLFAHDPLGPSGDGSDGLIACGSYTGTGAVGNAVDLGFEPQFLLIKSATAAYNWHIFDTMRGIADSGNATLYPNLSNAEINAVPIQVNSSGFTIQTTGAAINGNTGTYIYIAIRRGPMRQPTSGTEVFYVDKSGATEGQGVQKTTGFPVDLQLIKFLSGSLTNAYDRLRGVSTNTTDSGRVLYTNSTDAETNSPGTRYWDNEGYQISGALGNNEWAYWNFSRAPGFFDVVAYTGDGVAGRTVPHNLGVAPELMIVKCRNAVTNWFVYHADEGATERGFLDATNAFSSFTGAWNNTAPTDSVFTVGTGAQVNTSGNTYIAYLFATLAGVSKVGSYTGNSGTQTIDCGFTTGARFVMVKAASTSGAWFVWDTARGIVSGTEPYLRLNSSVAEENGYDAIDPDSSGFTLNNVGTGTNDSGTTYIFLAIA